MSRATKLAAMAFLLFLVGLLGFADEFLQSVSYNKDYKYIVVAASDIPQGAEIQPNFLKTQRVYVRHYGRWYITSSNINLYQKNHQALIDIPAGAPIIRHMLEWQRPVEVSASSNNASSE